MLDHVIRAVSIRSAKFVKTKVILWAMNPKQYSYAVCGTMWETTAHQRAWLTAFSVSHSACRQHWPHARRISSRRLRLEEANHVAVALRLGVDLCHPHTDLLSVLLYIDAKGIHGLSFKSAVGRMSRHQALDQWLDSACPHKGEETICQVTNWWQTSW